MNWWAKPFRHAKMLKWHHCPAFVPNKTNFSYYSTNSSSANFFVRQFLRPPISSADNFFVQQFLRPTISSSDNFFGRQYLRPTISSPDNFFQYYLYVTILCPTNSSSDTNLRQTQIFVRQQFLSWVLVQYPSYCTGKIFFPVVIFFSSSHKIFSMTNYGV